MTISSPPITAPYKMGPDEQSFARAAFSWSMRPDLVAMVRNLRAMSPEGRLEILLTTDLFAGSLFRLVKQDIAEGLLPVPNGDLATLALERLAAVLHPDEVPHA